MAILAHIRHFFFSSAIHIHSYVYVLYRASWVIVMVYAYHRQWNGEEKKPLSRPSIPRDDSRMETSAVMEKAGEFGRVAYVFRRNKATSALRKKCVALSATVSATQPGNLPHAVYLSQARSHHTLIHFPDCTTTITTLNNRRPQSRKRAGNDAPSSPRPVAQHHRLRRPQREEGCALEQRRQGSHHACRRGGSGGRSCRERGAAGTGGSSDGSSGTHYRSSGRWQRIDEFRGWLRWQWWRKCRW